jgi:nicotinamidase/pyrazinamidase
MYALLIIDVQNDFCPNGELAVPNGDKIIPVINSISPLFECIVQTQDWHPINHSSFASNHIGLDPYDTFNAEYGEQILWPNHCVQDSKGADFHPNLVMKHTSMIIRKGFRSNIDSYSAFFENDHRTSTGLKGYLDSIEVDTVFIAGLATDFCVKWTALDSINLGFKTYVVEDAIKGIDIDNSVEKSIGQMKETGIEFIHSNLLTSNLLT